jgi:hypothetical protein
VHAVRGIRAGHLRTPVAEPQVRPSGGLKARSAALLTLAASVLAPRQLLAEPQGHVALRTAFCGAGENGEVWQETRFCGGVLADLLFLRERNHDFGFGPYLELNTAGFFDVRWGGGASVLVPAFENLPFVLQLGAYGHELEAVALGASLFFGARSYNFSSAYNVAVGAFIGAYRDLDSERASLLVAGFELDGFIVALPFLLGVRALD